MMCPSEYDGTLGVPTPSALEVMTQVLIQSNLKTYLILIECIHESRLPNAEVLINVYLTCCFMKTLLRTHKFEIACHRNNGYLR